MVTDLLLQATPREPYRALVLSRPSLSQSTDHQDHNLHSFNISSVPVLMQLGLLLCLLHECEHVCFQCEII